MKKRITALIAAVLLCLAMCACGSNDTIPDDKGASEPVEYVVGKWVAQGVIYEEQIVSFEDNEALADLYDLQWITFSDDGTFSIQSGPWAENGKWAETELNGDVTYAHAYVLQQEESVRFVVGDDDELKEEISEGDNSYLAYIMTEDENTMIVVESEGEGSDIVLIYVKDGAESAVLNGTVTVDDGASYDNDADYDTNRSYSAADTATSGERNALQKAYDYLNVTAFSYEGLVEQLEYEGFTNAEAKYAADHCGADWYEQAALKAQDYLEISSFSRSGLIEQLEYEGFTYDQATYGVDKVY